MDHSQEANLVEAIIECHGNVGTVEILVQGVPEGTRRRHADESPDGLAALCNEVDVDRFQFVDQFTRRVLGMLAELRRVHEMADSVDLLAVSSVRDCEHSRNVRSHLISRAIRNRSLLPQRPPSISSGHHADTHLVINQRYNWLRKPSIQDRWPHGRGGFSSSLRGVRSEAGMKHRRTVAVALWVLALTLAASRAAFAQPHPSLQLGAGDQFLA